VRVYFDRYVDDHWGAIESTNLVTWTDISDKIEMVPHARHGTVVRVEQRVVDKLKKALSSQ
jgi:hypothetical protein